MGQSILTRIVDAVGTPTYVYDAARIRERFTELQRALHGVPVHIHYAVKANSNLAILGLIRELGAGADIVSAGELARVAAAGFHGRQILFSGVGKTEAELTAAVHAEVGCVNLESVDEFERLVRVCPPEKAPVRVGIRINPDVTTDTHPYTQTGEGGMKFGVPLDQVNHLAEHINESDRCVLVSIGLHIGSQIADAASYADGAERLVALLTTLREQGLAENIESVDLGGGLGISYTDEPALDLPAYAEVVRRLAERTGLHVLTEPGRFIVGNAGVLLTRVEYTKHSGGRRFVIVDGGMNDLLRPALYAARHPVNVVNGAGANRALVDVVGPLCESGDFLAKDVELPVVNPGDVLAVGGAGAYGFVMSSNYNSRPRAAEVLMDGDQFAVVRGRERLESLMADETPDAQWR